MRLFIPVKINVDFSFSLSLAFAFALALALASLYTVIFFFDRDREAAPIAAGSFSSRRTNRAVSLTAVFIAQNMVIVGSWSKCLSRWSWPLEKGNGGLYLERVRFLPRTPYSCFSGNILSPFCSIWRSLVIPVCIYFCWICVSHLFWEEGGL